MNLTPHARSSSRTVPLRLVPGGFVNGIEKRAGIDGIFTSGSPTSFEFVVIHNAREVLNEELVDVDSECAGDFVEDIDRGVGRSTLDLRNGLASDSGGFSERGL